jgi:hypothetical protein
MAPPTKKGVEQTIRETMEKLSPEAQAVFSRRLERVLTRQKALARFPTPAHLSQFWRKEFYQTPMLDAIDRALMLAEARSQPRWIINTPPQRGKTSRMQDGAAWMLLRNPGLNIVFCSYEQGIAGQSSLAIRQMIETYGSGYRNVKRDPLQEDHLGLLLDPDRAQQTRWSLADVPDGSGRKPGGIAAVGIGGALTGRQADVIIVDDPIKDAKQADSKHARDVVKNWFQSVALTRLSKDGIVIVVQTRWHEDDLSGWLLHNEPDRWEHLNIPAQAIENDPLGRQPGEYLIDARGFEAADWEQVKKDVGGRTWFALYQGNPTPPEGGIFQREWFDNNRVPVAPELNAIRTFIDPADNTGEGDEAGIITAGIGVDGHIYLLSDDSGHYTVAQWFRKAMYALMKHKGTRLAYEKSLSGLKRSMEAEWRTMRNQAIELRDRWRTKFPTDTWSTVPDPTVIDEVVALNSTKDDTIIYKKTLEMQLIEMWPWVPKMMEFSPSGPSIEAVVARGSKTFRAEMVSPLYENGTVRHVGQMPTLEHQMASWLPTQNSPDRMDAAVHIVAKLNSLNSAGAAVAKPTARISRPSPRIGGPYRNR